MQGILRAGGAYVPLDPNYPAPRLADITAGAQVAAVVTQAKHRERLGEIAAGTVCLDEQREALAALSGRRLEPAAEPSHLIYVIGTSGTTGRPKAAAVYHRGFRNLLDWFVREFHIGPQDRTLVITSYGFDLTQKNYYAPLMTGGTLVLSDCELYDPELIAGEIGTQQITLLNCTPSNFHGLVSEQGPQRLDRLNSLRLVFLGGEPIDLSKLQPWLRHPGCRATSSTPTARPSAATSPPSTACGPMWTTASGRCPSAGRSTMRGLPPGPRAAAGAPGRRG